MITLQDFTLAIKSLAQKPRFTILTTLIMAVGIGLSVYQFSFLNTLAYKALPFEDGESLVLIRHSRNGQVTGTYLKLHDFEEIRTTVKGLSELIAYKDADINISGRDGVKQYSANYTEPNIFELSRTQPILGRTFTTDDDKVGAEEVVVIGYDLWQNMLGGTPNVIGQSIRVNSVPTRIIGVMPKGYYFPITTEVWLPLRKHANELARDSGAEVGGLAHLSPGTTMNDVNAQLTNVMLRLEDKYPNSHSGVSAFAGTIPEMVIGDSTVITAMQLVSIILLLLASINVGNLLLARTIERSKETAIRMALGAPRSRIISRTLSESIIICGTGGAIGLLITTWILGGTAEALTRDNGDGTPLYWFQFGLDSFTIAIFFGFLITTILVTGLLPAWKTSGADFNAVLRDGTRGALGKKTGRLNKALVISEVFLSITVLIIASVIVTGAYASTKAEYGVDISNKLIANIQLNDTKYAKGKQMVSLVKNLQLSLDQNTSISESTIASSLPGQFTWAPLIAVDGHEYVDESSYPRANYVSIMPGFFKALDIKLLQGRSFNSTDDGLDKRTVIVTQSFANRHFPNNNIIGQRVRITEEDGDTPQWLKIIGIVEHTTYAASGLIKDQQGTIFRPLSQAPRQDLTVSLTMGTNEKQTLTALRNTLKAIDPDLPAFNTQTYKRRIDRNNYDLIFMSKVFMLFSLVALGLASSGIYGVMANTTLQRTQETGVKRALGATEAAITKEFLWQGFKQLLWGAIPGILAGCAIGFTITQIITINNALLGVLCFLVTSIIGVVVMLATYLPTKQALNMEPSQALRHE